MQVIINPYLLLLLSHFSRVQLCATPWTVACQAPLSIGFSRQEYWSGLPCPPPRDLPNPGIEPVTLTSSALAGVFFTILAGHIDWDPVHPCNLLCSSILSLSGCSKGSSFPRRDTSVALQVLCFQLNFLFPFIFNRLVPRHPSRIWLDRSPWGSHWLATLHKWPHLPLGPGQSVLSTAVPPFFSPSLPSLLHHLIPGIWPCSCHTRAVAKQEYE